MRNLFVLLLVAIGGYYALQSPFYTLLFYIANAYFRPEDWAWGEFVNNLKLSFTAGILVLFMSIFSGQRFIMNSRLAWMFLFSFQAFLSTLTSQDFSWSFSCWSGFFKGVIITYLIVVLITDLPKFRLLLFTMVMALGLEGAKQGWFYLITSPDWGENPNKIPFLGDNNGVAVGMLMLAPIVILLWQTTQKKWARPLYLIVLVGVIGRALTTYSRGAFIAAIALTIFYLTRVRNKFRSLLALLLMLVVLLLVLPQEYWERMRTIQTYEETEEKSALSRIHFWKVAILMANDNPVLGVGYMAYGSVYNEYDFSHGRYGKNRECHSSYLQILAEQGYVGIFLFMGTLLSAFRNCSRVRRGATNEFVKGAFALEASLVSFLIGGAFLSFASVEMLWHILGLTIALERIATQNGQKATLEEPSSLPRKAFATAVGRAA
jgi:probable O-glycosylation ligase (exosortase A-associated)